MPLQVLDTSKICQEQVCECWDREISSGAFSFWSPGPVISSERNRSENIQFGKFHRQTEFELAVKLVSCVEIPVVDLKKEAQSSMTPEMRSGSD